MVWAGAVDQYEVISHGNNVTEGAPFISVLEYADLDVPEDALYHHMLQRDEISYESRNVRNLQ